MFNDHDRSVLFHPFDNFYASRYDITKLLNKKTKKLYSIALMRDEIRAAKSPPSLALRMQILNFIMNLNSQSNNDEKNTHVKITRRQRRFEKMSRKRGLVVNFEHVTSSRIRPI